MNPVAFRGLSHRLKHPHRATRIQDCGVRSFNDARQHIGYATALTQTAVFSGDSKGLRDPLALQRAKEPILGCRAHDKVNSASTLAQLLGQSKQRRSAVAAADQHTRNRFGGQHKRATQRANDVNGIVALAISKPSRTGSGY